MLLDLLASMMGCVLSSLVRPLHVVLIPLRRQKRSFLYYQLLTLCVFIGDSLSGRNVQRSNYKAVQTPQVFDIQLIKKAYEQEESTDFTDDASVVERLGQVVTMVEGNRENIKITTPFDLKVAEVLLFHES